MTECETEGRRHRQWTLTSTCGVGKRRSRSSCPGLMKSMLVVCRYQYAAQKGGYILKGLAKRECGRERRKN